MSFPYHPLLLATFVWLSPYTSNRDELFFEDVLASAVTATGAAGVLLLLIGAALRNARRAGLVVSLLLVIMVYYGQAYEAVDNLLGGTVSNKLFMPLWTAPCMLVIGFLVIRRPRLENLTKVLNAGALVLVLLPFGTLIVGLSSDKSATATLAEPSRGLRDPVPTGGDRAAGPDPDIYFLIFDRYAGERTLKDVYDFDNRDFLESLRKRGFFVVERSRANYTKTAHSLAATLNLKHLTYLSEQIGPGSSNWRPVVRLMQDSEVIRYVKARGYRYLHLGSWWEPTRENPLADENYFARRLLPGVNIHFNEFETLLLRPTLPIRVNQALFGGDSWERHQFQFVRVGRKFEKLATLQRQDAPIFVFAHMLIPHFPNVFYADGRYKSPAEARAMTREQNYVDQLIHANRKIKELLNELLAKTPPPVIIIQSDEGPFPQRYFDYRKTFDWRLASVRELRQKFRILNAIYFPDGSYSELYDGMTPVNTFRIIFNKYFGEEFPMLPDVSYTFYSHSDLYSFLDVTWAVK